MILTLVFVHGFLGNETTFHQMPQELEELLQGCFPEDLLKSELFIYGNLSFHYKRFIIWSIGVLEYRTIWDEMSTWWSNVRDEMSIWWSNVRDYLISVDSKGTNNAEKLYDFIAKQPGDCHIVSHSMGGIFKHSNDLILMIITI